MFHNIFENKGKKSRINEKEKPEIIIDLHEKNSTVISELKSSGEVKIKIEDLKIGDYLIGDIIIERKTLNDFISSMLNKRLVEQLKQIKSYEKRVLVIEGNKKEYTMINEKLLNAVRGFIISIITNHQIPIIKTKNSQATANFLIKVSKQQRKKDPVLHQRIPKTITEQKRYVLESFSGIGPKKSELLLKKFKTLKNIFNANEEDLKEILKKDTKKFRLIIETDYFYK